MQILERDPLYIAEQVRFIRGVHRLTQENLADAASVSTRTIEKVESGRHRPSEQTLRNIARALQLDLTYFEKPTPEQEAYQRENFERAVRKTAVVEISPIRSARNFLDCFGEYHGLSFDTSKVADDMALNLSASIADWLGDLTDVWSICSMRERVEYARQFVVFCQELEELGYVCLMGSYWQQLPKQNKDSTIFHVALVTLLPKEEENGTGYAIIPLHGQWETVEER